MASREPAGGRSRVLWAIIIAVLTAAPLTAAQRPLTSGELLQGLQDWLDATRSLEGGFEQQLVSGALGSGIEESGRLFIGRPGRMRWEYVEPERKIALIDQDLTWLYLEEEGELYLGRLEDQSDLLPRLLAGEGRLRDAFEAEIVKLPERPRKGAYQLRLVPKGEGEAFEHLMLVVRAPEFGIEAAEVLDPAGNRIRYRFSDLKRNRPLSEELFQFDPPEGTLVLGQH